MTEDAAGRFDREMTFNAQAFAERRFVEANSALMYALYAAAEIGDEARLLRAAKTADEQGRSLDSSRPDQPVSRPMV